MLSLKCLVFVLPCSHQVGRIYRSCACLWRHDWRKWQEGVRHMYMLVLTFICITSLHVGVVSHVNIHRNSMLRTWVHICTAAQSCLWWCVESLLGNCLFLECLAAVLQLYTCRVQFSPVPAHNFQIIRPPSSLRVLSNNYGWCINNSLMGTNVNNTTQAILHQICSLCSMIRFLYLSLQASALIVLTSGCLKTLPPTLALRLQLPCHTQRSKHIAVMTLSSPGLLTGGLHQIDGHLGLHSSTITCFYLTYSLLTLYVSWNLLLRK